MACKPQAVVTVHALSAGHFTLPERFFVVPNSLTATRTVPSLAFLIQHSSATEHHPKTTRLLFDLGLRREPSAYSAPIRKHISTRQPMSTSPDVVASLAQGGLAPSDIDYVVLSHVHWDHIGMPSDFANLRTRFIVGPGSLDLLNGTNKVAVGSHSYFEADLLPPDRTIKLPNVPAEASSSANPEASDPPSGRSILRWRPLGDILPDTIDLFGDGSLYIVDAPGHLPGHINVLARTSATKSVYLAGDVCHDMRLFNGTHRIATWEDDAGKTCCIHVDGRQAEETVARIRRLAQEGLGGGTVEVVFAHSPEWEDLAKEDGRFWPGML
jgi:glyoxylase-like metal-dependent hydrolase (beta-lactamase superfamily II)